MFFQNVIFGEICENNLKFCSFEEKHFHQEFKKRKGKGTYVLVQGYIKRARCLLLKKVTC
jgi:hypothetical protein